MQYYRILDMSLLRMTMALHEEVPNAVVAEGRVVDCTGERGGGY